MGMERKVKKVWWENSKERDHFEDRGVDGRMGSEWILERLARGCTVVGTRKYDDKLSGSGATDLVSTDIQKKVSGNAHEGCHRVTVKRSSPRGLHCPGHAALDALEGA
jgi:hypothetical protein